MHMKKCSTSLIIAAKSLQLCPTLCDPIDGSPPGFPVPGIPRQEHWSGLPFPSPMHESEKWKWSRSVVSDPQRPHGLQPSRLLRPWDFPGKSTGVGWHRLLCHSLYSHPFMTQVKYHLCWFILILVKIKIIVFLYQLYCSALVMLL